MPDENHDSTPAAQEPRLSEKELRGRRRLLIVAGVILVPIAATICGACCCFGGLFIGESLGCKFDMDGAFAWALYSFPVGAAIGGGLLFFYLRNLWKKKLSNLQCSYQPQD